jgi:hypothetical protein
MLGMEPFSLRRLFAAVTLIAVGCGALVYLFRTEDQAPAAGLWKVLAAFWGAPLIGAGLLTPIRRPALGAILGFLAFMGFLFYLASRLMI